MSVNEPAAAKDRDREVAQKLAEGVQADRGSAESPTENLAVSYGDSAPDAGSLMHALMPVNAT